MLGHLVFCLVIISTDIWNIILTYIWGFLVLKVVYKFLEKFHISVKIWYDLSIYAYIGRYTFNIALYMITYSDHICFHISGVIRPLHISVNISPLRLNHINITYIDQYMPTGGIYRSIYVIFQWFKLGAYIGPIYLRSYNDRYIKTYILPIYFQTKILEMSFNS